MNWSNHYTLINTLISGTICSIVNSNQSIKHWKIEEKKLKKTCFIQNLQKKSINQSNNDHQNELNENKKQNKQN